MWVQGGSRLVNDLDYGVGVGRWPGDQCDPVKNKGKVSSENTRVKRAFPHYFINPGLISDQNLIGWKMMFSQKKTYLI